MAPPTRLDIQSSPWAAPRSSIGIQSEIIREIDGKVPAWKAPKRNRTTRRKPTIQATFRGSRTTSTSAAVSVEPPRMIAARMFRTPNRSPRKPQGISKRP